MATKSGVIVLRGKGTLQELAASLRLLSDLEVLVGFPEESTNRTEDTNETDAYGKPTKGVEGSDITNAALGYIHDNGAPEAHIPARPFMTPGIEDARAAIISKMANITNAVVRRGGGTLVVEQGLMQVGLIAKLAIQNKINEGIPPPLAASTLRARGRKGRKGAGIELLARSKGHEAGMAFAKPLVDTGQLRNAVNFVIRSKKERKR